MPSITLPVPPQFGHSPESTLPLALQVGQMFSPVPGVPAGAWSPGLVAAVESEMSIIRLVSNCLRTN
jgi:hypothetical protein